ncbi:FAD-binding protein [Gordonibacter sp. An230]|uniref:FAD-binding protein n=1 Tax=Gordonibacter sp. An230 TaxID=1965592 RepID=UPI0013A6791B|nr:FAD-binding protein [Gordonibacter sp. An230]
MEKGITRRNLIKLGSVIGIGALAATATNGCAPKTQTSSYEAHEEDSDQATFLKQPEPITEFADTKEFDIVVVGAGESGLSAVHTALESGASVACVQNIGTAQTTGNMGASVDTTKTDEAGIEACVTFLMEKNAWRSDRKLVEAWAWNSYEAVCWWADAAANGGAESKPFDSSKEYNGYTFHLHANTYNHLEGAHNDAALAIAKALEQEGAEFFYNSPAVQLHTENGRVTGAICERDGSHTLFKAHKGVILASGDCSGNEQMRDYYCPDLRGFKTMSVFRDGSGMLAGIWAGACMTPINHSKMVHGGGALTRLQVPFLNLDIHGKRFMNEVLSFAYLNNLMREYLAEYDYQNSMAAKFFTIMPSNWLEIAQTWADENPAEVQLGVGNMKAPDESAFIKGDTFEELAANINAYMESEQWMIDPIDEQTIVQSIQSYNDLCATGADKEFGKRAKYLVPIAKGPFYAVPRGANSVPAILGGLIVNENQQCLDAGGELIEGLFAVGNASGQFYGGVDYPMDIEGLSIGRAITSGYMTGHYVASL